MVSRGFTLIEVLLSVTIIAMLAGISLPLYASYANRNDLDLATQAVVRSLRRAQTYSRAVNYDSQWGVSMQTDGVVVFRGTSYATRDSAFDELTIIPTSIVDTGLTEVVFSKLAAAPSTTGNIVLTSVNNDVRTVTLNAEGMVNY